MKKIIKFAVNYPVTITMFFLGIILLGIISFSNLGMDLFPVINNPKIYVELQAGEYSPEEIEKKFVKNIESKIYRLNNVTDITSTSKTGYANITVEYLHGTNKNEAFLDVQKALADIQQDDTIEDLAITQYDPNAVPIVLFNFYNPEIDNLDELRKSAESLLRNELVRIEGIADVKILGSEEKEIIVETNMFKLNAYNIKPSDIASKITQTNKNITGGSITELGLKYIIKGVNEFKDINQIRNTIILYKTNEKTPNEKIPVFLKDIAKVKFQNKEPDNIVHVNRKRCIVLAVYKETNYNTVKVVNEFNKELSRIKKTLPAYSINIIQNQGNFIINAINEVKETLIYGILLAIIVLFIFLRKINTTLIISLAIPISVISTFNLMYFNNLTLNIMTLGGLALGAGMLVDNAIIVMESIFRNLENGINPKDSAVKGTAQVAGAIIASTLTTIIVFLPIVYLKDTSAELFKDQAWTVAFSLISSLVVAILLIPMLSSRWLKNKTKNNTDKINNNVKSIKFKSYAKLLKFVLKIRWIVIILTIAIIVGSIFLLKNIGNEFLPKTNSKEYKISIKLPEGTTLQRTESTVNNIEEKLFLNFKNNIQLLYSISGKSEISNINQEFTNEENTAELKLIFKKDSKLTYSQIITTINKILQQSGEMKTFAGQEQTTFNISIGNSLEPLVINILGKDLDILHQITEKIKNLISKNNNLFNIKTNFDDGKPELNIIIDPVRANLNNLDISSIKEQLENFVSGTSAGEFNDKGDLIDITVKLPDKNIKDIYTFNLNNGENDVLLTSISKIKISKSPVAIDRQNQVRLGQVTANIKKNIPLSKIISVVNPQIKNLDLPNGYKIKISGEELQRKNAFNNLMFALILSFILVYMVLASQFESLIHPFTIILSIPLAISGTIILFFILGKNFNIMSYIGIIMLTGIAVNDSIIFVDAINRLKATGLSCFDSIIEAGQQRIRPIIITSLTTILALLPLTLGIGEGSELRESMALAVIGGLISSTILTLIVIPCIYFIIDRKKI